MSNFDSNIIKNPEIFEQNRLAAHSDHVCYKNELEKIKGKSSLRYDMNGLWKFAYAKNQSLAPCGFEAADYDCKTGMKSGFRHISRWKAMTCQSIRIPHIRGRLMSL